jgi:hypothetical protein
MYTNSRKKRNVTKSAEEWVGRREQEGNGCAAVLWRMGGRPKGAVACGVRE